jgi:hypothetical protein
MMRILILFTISESLLILTLATKSQQKSGTPVKDAGHPVFDACDPSGAKSARTAAISACIIQVALLSSIFRFPPLKRQHWRRLNFRKQLNNFYT